MPSRTSARGRLVGVAVYVSDLAAAVRFYREHLGFAVEAETSEQATVVAGEGRIVLSRRWWPPTLAGVHPFTPTPMLAVDDAVAAARALEASGVRVLMRPTPLPDGTTIAEVLDPDGNVLRLRSASPCARARRGASPRKGRR